jgi:hypothetical protein
MQPAAAQEFVHSTLQGEKNQLLNIFENKPN